MLQDIQTQIRNIGDTLAWIERHKPEQYVQRFSQLIQERSKLRRLAAAEADNPAIAAYGESQKGKSYVMSNLLQTKEKPFYVAAGGKLYNFIEDINPITNNSEATGVVTRFSAFKRRPEHYRADHPVLVKLLSVTDIVAILCDGYFNDIHDYQTDDDEAIKQQADQLYEKYHAAPAVQDVVIEDDVFDLQQYMCKYIGSKSRPLWRSSYFMQLALVIRRVPSTEWVGVFSLLWHNDPSITSLFERLLTTLTALDYAAEAYLDIEAVLNDRNTIMSVDCLKGIRDDEPVGPNDQADVYFADRSGAQRTARGVRKCLLSAVCKEVVFKIDDDYLDTSDQYALDMVAPEVQATLQTAPVEKHILRDNDLMDFPGAKPRLTLMASFIPNEIDKVLLRGKVGFLFNKYCNSMAINILLFCQDHQAGTFTLMYKTLDEWIGEYVGATPEKRAERIRQTGGVAPFFFIATKFNVDMAQMSNPAANRLDQLDKRWEQRFIKVAYDACFMADSTEWFNNWDAVGSSFKNSYLLRDYKYSNNIGSGSKLYDGYSTTSPREERCLIRDVDVEGHHMDLYAELRRSFVENRSVRRFFADPAKAWDVAATINNDGALYIIERLSIVAQRMGQARDAFFAEKLDETKRALRSVLKDYYKSEDAEEQLQENLRVARQVVRELDFTCNDDNYYFGHLVQALQVTEKMTYQEVHRLIHSGELTGRVHNFDNYEIIRRSCSPRLEQCTSDGERWQCLIDAYGFASQAEAVDYLERRGVDPKLLFAPTAESRTNSACMAESVTAMWYAHLASPQLVSELTGERGFNNVIMASLLERVASTARELHLADRIERLIAETVNVVNMDNINVGYVADLMASEINNFVTDLGFHCRDAENQAQLRQMDQQLQLRLFAPIDQERPADYDEASLTALFHTLTERPQAITPAVEHNYYAWRAFVVIAFIGQLAWADYDHEANRQLKVIIDNVG